MSESVKFGARCCARGRSMGRWSPKTSDPHILIPLQGWDAPNALSRFSHLRNLVICIEIPINASAFSEESKQDAWGTLPIPPWKETLAKSIACDMFRKFFYHDAYSLLKTLELRFSRLRLGDRGEVWTVNNSIFVHRLERDDSPRPEDGGFEVDCEHKWPTDKQ